MRRKIFSGILLALILTGVLMVRFDILLTSTSQETQLLLETDKNKYELGESVTITLTNIGDQPVIITQDPPWIICTYPDNELVYPASPINREWVLHGGANYSWVWCQVDESSLVNEFSLYVPAEPGNYVIKDTQKWGLSVHITIVTSIVVPDDYPTIQKAIDASSDGSTIYVMSGRYRECITIDKALRIVGENKENTTIDGINIPRGNVVSILSSDVSLYNFTIKHPDADPHNGIEIGSSAPPFPLVGNITIRGNNITNCDDGIFIWNGSDINIECNEFDRNWIHGINSAWASGIRIRIFGNTMVLPPDMPPRTRTGIHVTESKNSIFSDNKITNYVVGIYTSGDNGSTYVDNELRQCSSGISIEGGRNNLVSYNQMYDNDLCISLGGGSNNTVTDNEISGNSEGTGIRIRHSGNNTAIRNTISNIESGIHFIYSTNNSVTDNYVYNCSQACELEYSQDNVIEANVIQACSCGISTDDYSTDNKICRNGFFGNTVHALQLGTNRWENNYWSDYEGIDTDGDGIGDTETPHHKDRYPFIVPIGPILVYFKETEYNINIDGSMTVSRFTLDENKTVSFTITGEGFVNLTIPRKILDGSFKILINNAQIPHEALWDKTCNFICFEYATSVPVNVEIEAQMKFQGDLYGDGKVDILDIALVAIHFGAELEDP